jgi:PAS domain S-box-containing protein
METHAAPLRNPDGSVAQLAVTRDVTERKRAEQALQQSEKKYREFAESATIALHWVGPDGIILWANQAELDMLGYSAEEYIGQHIAKCHVDAPALDDILTRLCRGEKLREYEARLRAKDGSIRHVLIDSSVLFENGKFIHTRCFTRDITESKRSEQALRESEQRFRVITEASPVLVWMAGTDKLCYYFNKGWLDFVGRTLEQETGNGWAENVHRDDFDRCLQIYVENFDARRPFEMEYRLRHHSGQYRWILDHGVPRYAPDGTFEGYVGGCLDIHDQKEAAEKLRIAAEEVRESEERYRTVAETASDAIVSIDESSTILFANSATAEVFGYAPQELIGKNLTMLMPDYMRRVHEAGLRRYVDTGHRHLNWEATELPGLHKDGREIPLEVSFGDYTKAGKHYFTGFARDITERKRAQEALRQSEMEFRNLANSMPTLVWMANPDGWIFWYNQRWYEYTGTTPEQMEGWGWQSVHDPEVLPTVVERWKRSIASGEPFEMTFPLRGADGQFRPFLTRVTPIRDSSGSIARWFGTNTDVSSEVEVQKKLQTALFASQKLAAIVESSDDAILSKDMHGIVTAWNPAAEKLFGYSAQEIIGHSIMAIVPPELQQDEQTILATIGRGEKVDHFETVRMTKSGARIHVSVTVSPIRDESGNLIGAANVTRDITQQRSAEQALRTTERLAAVGRLAATVAHEINNPLAAVTNLIYLSKQSAVRDDVKEFLTSAEEELERVSHLTKQTLGFYRESKDPIAITLGSVVESTISVFAPRMRNRSVTVRRDIRQDPEICAVPSELRQLVGNLLSNSIDAVESGGRIQIRVSAATRNGMIRGVRLTIADSGPGIPAQVRGRVFEPFFTTKKDVGTGLGLWICKGIVDRYSGSIRIWSRTTAGKSGTIVSVVLPASEPAQAITDGLKKAV